MATSVNSADRPLTTKDERRLNSVFALMFCRRATRLAAMAALLLLLLFTGASAGLAQSVTINEVESNGGTPGDWFELYNKGAIAVDISGWKMKDNDDGHAFYVIPAGTIIAPGGYFVGEEAAFGFGLGSADSVRIFDATETLYETHSWTAHATITYGRCPNGTGEFTTTVSSTKGAANDCPVRINEVESNGGTPGDWFELYNAGTSAFDISGWKMKDNDDTHAFYVFPTGTIIAPGGYFVGEEAAFGFGLGSADSVRIFDATEALYDIYSWTSHAAITYGRCPNGNGAFTNTASSTKGAANDCGGPPASPVRVNEVESSGGVPVDWIELYNPSATPADIGSFVLKDNDDTHIFTIAAGTMLAPGAYQAFDVDVPGGFGLGDADSARLFNTVGALVDSYSWTSHAATTYGRCPDGTGDFATTLAATKGVANSCRVYTTWPGGADVQTVDGAGVFGGNMSGLVYEGSGIAAPGVLWAVRNGPETLFRLVWNGTIWTPDTSNSWGAGKALFYPSGGTSRPDSEGVTFAGGSSTGGIYVSTERDNTNNSVSRNSILRFDPTMAGDTLAATNEWNLTADLPVTGANLGAEGIAWIPDTFLTANNFFDETKGHIYNPAEYPNHGAGLFFVGLEANGNIYAYALDQTLGSGAFNRIATISTGFPGVMDLQFDSYLSDFWAICDDTCQGRSVVLRIDGTGRFVVAGAFQRPGAMPNLNNEGYAITPESECVTGFRPVFWSDDSATDSHALRGGTLSCSPIVMFTDVIAPKAFPAASPSPNDAGWNIDDVNVAWNWADNPGGSGIDNANCTTDTLSSGEGFLAVNASCKDLAGNTGNAAYMVQIDKTDPIVTASATNADGTPYAFGTWSNQTVTVHYTCSDAVSGVASCSGDAVFNTDGESFASGSGTDNAGRTGSSGALSVRIDTKAPRVLITSPAERSYVNTAKVHVDWFAHDWFAHKTGSGIESQSVKLDGSPIKEGRSIDLFLLSLGRHTVVVKVTDAAGNSASDSASFTVIATADSIKDSIDRLLRIHAITNAGVANSLKAKVGGNPNQLNAFLKELNAQRGKKINQQAYDVLKAAALYLIAHPNPPHHFDGKQGHGTPDHHDHDSKRVEHYDFPGKQNSPKHDEYARR